MFGPVWCLDLFVQRMLQRLLQFIVLIQETKVVEDCANGIGDGVGADGVCQLLLGFVVVGACWHAGGHNQIWR